MLECVVNISVGNDPRLIDDLKVACGDALLDVHSDPHHNRSVFTLLGSQAPRDLAQLAVEILDLRSHSGVHPRLGVVDVVPFIPLSGSTMADAETARNEFAQFAADELKVPVFLYGAERTLPEIRRNAWKTLGPDLGPATAHPSAGAICVGVREPLVAYNVWLELNDLSLARHIAEKIRGPHLRSLGLQVGQRVQVSMNLVNPYELGPADAYDLVKAHAKIANAELVGLLPKGVLESAPAHRWQELDLSPDRVLPVS